VEEEKMSPSRARLAGECGPPWSHVKPVLSSAARGWDGIAVDLYRVRNVDVVAKYPDHTVSLVLRGPFNLLQRRYGRLQRRTMHAGDIIVTPVGEPKLLSHREEAEILKLRIASALLDRVIADFWPASRSVELLDDFGTRDAHIEGIARALLAEASSGGVAGRLYVESLTNQVVVHLLRHHSSAGRMAEDATAPLPRYKLRRATEYINDNLRDTLALKDIARTVSMSPYHFAHVFKRTVGVTPHHYVIERRIEKAKSLLRDTAWSVTEIAQHVGYTNPSHFSTVFQRFTGHSPRAYRRGA
jgi:AraC family transcriptional regulator